MNYSQFQLAIFTEMRARAGNVAINAVAGSGKTYTITEGARDIPRIYSVLMSAFGKDIAAEIRTRNLPPNCNISTYNAFGWGILRRATTLGRIVLEENKTDLTLQHTVLGARQEDAESWKRFQGLKGPIKRLVSLLKGQCKFTVEDAAKCVDDLIDHHAIEVPKDPDWRQVLLDTYKMVINNAGVMDFNDQIFQVLKQGLLIPAFDYVFVDEFQDTSEMEKRMMIEASRQGRFFGVGDPDQAIYGFRGATPDTFNKFVQEFKAKEMPLSICYRCPMAVIVEAQKIVPRIQHAPWARAGTVDTISTDQFLKMVRPGDFVICRTVAPCVKRCLQNIRDGLPARVFGRDIGSDLDYLIDKVVQGGWFISIPQFVDLLGEYVTRKQQAYAAVKAENLAMSLDDKYQTLLSFTEGCKDVSDVKRKITATFTDAKGENCILYMSGHKSKGLQCPNNVFVLRPDLLPHPLAKKPWMMEEERRLKYVMITRAMNGLFWVTKERNEK